jgi:eukaryotic-like serine/threonine-protein kinase
VEPLRAESERRVLGRYELLAELARGGMGVVYLARQVSPEVIERPVVVKRLHGSLATSEKLVRGLLDEARMLTHVRHPNVVPIIDVVEARSEAFLVLEHVDAVSLATLAEKTVEAGERMPPAIASRILGDVLAGLHAAHEAKNIRGVPLGIIHRDVSPQNVLVGADGVSRLIDFGIAKGAEREAGATTGAVLKGKVGYFAPEQLQEHEIDRRVDVFAAGVVLHEILVGKRLFGGDDHAKAMMRVLLGDIPLVSEVREGAPPALDSVLERALARHPDDRFATAAEFLEALTEAAPPASPIEVARWVERVCGAILESRRDELRTLVTAKSPSRRAPRRMLAFGALAALALGIAGVVAAKSSKPAERPAITETATSPSSSPAVMPSIAASLAPSIAPSAPSSSAAEPVATPAVAARPRPSARPMGTPPPTASSPSPSATSPLHVNPYVTAGSARP